jgi:hypothetical protein
MLLLQLTTYNATLFRLQETPDLQQDHLSELRPPRIRSSRPSAPARVRPVPPRLRDAQGFLRQRQRSGSGTPAGRAVFKPEERVGNGELWTPGAARVDQGKGEYAMLLSLADE